MPTSNSAKKRIKQNEAQRMRNVARRGALKTQIRKFLDAVHEKDVERSTKELRSTTKLLDQLAAKGTYHRNTIARKKSRLAARLNGLTAAGQ